MVKVSNCANTLLAKGVVAHQLSKTSDVCTKFKSVNTNHGATLQVSVTNKMALRGHSNLVCIVYYLVSEDYRY